MKTTIDLPDALLAEAKQVAASNRITLTEVISMGLRKAIAALESPPPFKLKDGSYGAGGLAPELTRGLHWDDIRDLVYPRPEVTIGPDGKETYRWPD